MRRFAVVLACVALFITGLLSRAPAWVVSDIARAQAPDVELGVASGTLWQGRLSHVAVQGLLLRDVQWQLGAQSVFASEPLRISLAEPAQVDLSLGVAGEVLRISALQAKGRIAPMLDALQIPAMGFDGAFNADISAASLSAQGCESLSGEVFLEQLSGDIRGLDALGRIRASLGCESGRVTVSIDDSNPLQLRGKVSVGPDGVPRGKISLTPPPQSEVYRSLSQMFGRPRNGKDFILQL